MSLIESYSIKEAGFNPFLIRNEWQVAQLNFNDAQHINNIDKIEVHHQTDEVFILLKGKAVLISVEVINDNLTFSINLMQPYITYNIPKNVWHNIAMQEESKVLIVEKSNTHLNDVSYKNLSLDKISELKTMVKKVLKI